MFDNKYEISSKGIPYVSFYREFNNLETPMPFTHMHYHSDFEILYIKKGTAKMLISGNTIILSDNSLLLINPYETHYGEITSTEFSYYCLDFDMKMLSLPKEKQMLNEEIKYINHLNGEIFKKYIKDAHNAFENEKTGWQLALTGNLLILFSHLETKLISTLPSKENEFTKKVINYLKENYANNITSKTISEALNYNQSYFCRMFKKSFSFKFCEYLNYYRIRKSKDILKTHNVSDTALLCGFSNMSYFSVTFKQYTGMTPIQYKTNILKKKQE